VFVPENIKLISRRRLAACVANVTDGQIELDCNPAPVRVRRTSALADTLSGTATPPILALFTSHIGANESIAYQF
jgi:hypothetical protein